MKTKIILVDPDVELSRLLASAFKNEGFELQTFPLGMDAMDFLSQEKNLEGVGLIILERVLPDMDGIAVLASFESQFPKKIPVFILSVLTSEKDILQAYRTGASATMEKPFSLSILLEKVKVFMRL